MQHLFEDAVANDFVGVKHEVVTCTERGHGRLDERTCHVIEIPKDHTRRAEWAGLRSLAVVVSRHEIAGQEQWESRLYISSLPAKAQPPRRSHCNTKHRPVRPTLKRPRRCYHNPYQTVTETHGQQRTPFPHGMKKR